MNRSRVVVAALLLIGIAQPFSLHAAVRVAPRPRTTAVASESLAVSTPQCIDVRTGTIAQAHARRLTANGSIDTAWTPAAGDGCAEPLQANVVSDGAGGSFAGWADGRRGGAEIYLQHLDAAGQVATGWPSAGRRLDLGSDSQYQLALIDDGRGGTFLAWQDYRSHSPGRVFVQHLSADGVAVEGWPSAGVAVTDTLVEQSTPQLALDAAGGVLVTWQDRRSGTLTVYLQRVSSTGARGAGWPANGLRLGSAGVESLRPKLASDAQGHVVLLWQAIESAEHQRLLAAAFSADIDPAAWNPAPFVIADVPVELSIPSVARFGSSDLLVGWTVGASAAGGTLRLQRLVFGSNEPSWPAGGVAVHQGAMCRAAPVMLPDTGGVVLTWIDLRNGHDSDIYAQRITAAGTRAAGWTEGGTAIAVSSSDEGLPALATDASGSTIVSWSDPADVRVRSSQELATMAKRSTLRLTESRLTPGHVRLIWQGALAASESLLVERRLPEHTWQHLAMIAANDSGQVIVDDRSVPEGVHVAYRLSSSVQDIRTTLEVVELDVPVAPKVIALHWVHFDGRTSALRLSFALPAGPAPTIEIIDVAGRRMAVDHLNGLEPGEHEETSTAAHGLSSGVYFVRLTQGSQSRVAKTILIR